MMDDRQLLALLAEKTPEQLTLDEIEHLRRRLVESPELRRVLREQLEMEAYLAEALGRVNVTADGLLAQARRRSAAESVAASLLALMACLGLLGLVGAVLVMGTLFAPAADPDREKETQQALVEPAGGETPEAAPDPPDGDDDSSPPISPRGTPDGADDEAASDDGKDGAPLSADLPADAAASSVVLRADQFLRGDAVLVDHSRFGSAEAPVVRSDAPGGALEYAIDLPRAGFYALYLRLAALEPRPLRITLNGRVAAEQAAAESTGGPSPAHQRELRVGEFPLREGVNVLRIEAAGLLPHLSRLRFEAIPAAKLRPWHETLADEPQPFDVWWRQRGLAARKPVSQEEIEQWFVATPQQNLRIASTRQDSISYGLIDGVARLASGLPEGAVLAMHPVGYDKPLRLHVYHGERGVSICQYDRSEHRLVGYVTQRERGAAIPSQWTICDTVSGRWSRTEVRYAGMWLLWYREGELCLYAGDVPLIRAPLDGPPTEVFFEGKLRFERLTLHRVDALPPPTAELPVLLDIARPADLSWIADLPADARYRTTDDGALELVGHQAERPGWVATPLPEGGPLVVDLLLENIGEEASVFLAGPDPQAPDGPEQVGLPRVKPREVVGFSLNQRTKRLVAMNRDFGHRNVNWTQDPPAIAPETSVGEAGWVRLIVAFNQVRYLVGPDGRHWADPIRIPPRQERGFTHVGIGFAAQTNQSGLRLRRIVFRRLPRLEALAAADRYADASALPITGEMGIWLAAAVESRPGDLAMDVWLQTCALRTLGHGVDEYLGRFLVESLWRAALARGPAAADLASHDYYDLLDELSLLLPARPPHEWDEHALRMAERYREVAERFPPDGAAAVPEYRRRLMSAPLVSPFSSNTYTTSLIHRDLTRLAAEEDWESLERLCCELRYFAGSEEYLGQRAPLVPWAEALAAPHLPRQGSAPPPVPRPEWRPLLVEQLGKEAYNVIADLQIALAGAAWEDACRVIMAIDAQAIRGLAPSPHDPRLLFSVPAAIEQAMRDRPPLRETMVAQFGELARLRIARATAEGDADDVELATLQFFGTEAAAEGRRWLGDRALAGGRFTEAQAHYGSGLSAAGTALREELLARMRLAAAMQGRRMGSPVAVPVQLGETLLAAAEFERIVADALRNRSLASSSPATGTAEAWPRSGRVPPPSGMAAVARARLDGPAGQSPQYDTRITGELGVPLFDRQIAATIAEGRLYLSNRFQTAAYDLEGGSRVWQSPAPPGKGAQAAHWPLVPMRPLLVGERVLVRQLNEDGPVLTCLRRDTGERLWHVQESSAQIISDPLLLQDEPVALALRRSVGDLWLLRLLRFDLASGQIVAEHPLAELRSGWFSRHYCGVAPLDDGLVAALGGVVLACDNAGRLRWIRTQLATPRQQDFHSARQFYDPPLVVGGLAYVQQPGVKTIECIEVASGALRWQRPLFDVQRLVGLSGGRLIVQTGEGWEGLDPHSGETLWRIAQRPRLQAVLCDEGMVLAAADRLAPGKDNKLRLPELLWIDPAAGQIAARAALPELAHERPQLGTLVSHADRLYVLFGRGDDDRNRDLVELVAQGAAEPAAALTEPRTLAAWTSHFEGEIRGDDEVQRVLPGWTLLRADRAAVGAPAEEVFGQRGVLVTGFHHYYDHSVVLARPVQVPDFAAAKLRLRVGSVEATRWRLEVRFQGETIWSQPLNEPESRRNWHDLTVDLSPYRGEYGWLILCAVRQEGSDNRVLWQRIELSP